MKNKKNQPKTFENTHKPNKYQNKKSVPIVMGIIGIFVIAIGLGITIASSKTNEGKIQYDEYTELTAAPGQEYTTVDEYGNEYDVKEDGMYCNTNFGYIKVNYGNPINKYNTYNYVLESGASCSFTLNKNGTYTYIFTYSDGGGFKASGKFDMKFGVNDVFNALNITNAQEFEDAFLISSGALNPKDLFVVTLKNGDVTYFNSDGEEITYAVEDEKYHNSFDDIEKNETSAYSNENVLDELVIYLSKNEETDNINASAYDVTNKLLFNQANINGHITVKTEE